MVAPRNEHFACPACLGITNVRADGAFRRRRHVCVECGGKFWTVEAVVGREYGESAESALGRAVLGEMPARVLLEELLRRA